MPEEPVLARGRRRPVAPWTHVDIPGRDAPDQHPASSIEGLAAAIAAGIAGALAEGDNVTITDVDGVLVISATGGVTVHDELDGRDAPDQHPIAAIEGLGSILDELESDIAAIEPALDDVVANAQLRSEKNQPNGYAGLNPDGVIPTSQIPTIAIGETFTVASQAAMLALPAQRGDVAIRSDQDRVYRLGGSGDPTVLVDWIILPVPADVVQSINGQIGIVVLGYADVGAAAVNDPRLFDQRTPTDNSVTNAKVATGAAIALSKLAITGTPTGAKFLRGDGQWIELTGVPGTKTYYWDGDEFVFAANARIMQSPTDPALLGETMVDGDTWEVI